MTRVFKFFAFAFVMIATVAMTAPAGAAGTPEVQITDIEVGTGPEVVSGIRLMVHYTGWTMDGKQFDTSRETDTPFEFTLGAREVIRGWDIGLQGMRVGGKRELIIPSELAYGKKGFSDAIAPNSDLKFEIELLEAFENRVTFVETDEVVKLVARGVPVIDLRRPNEWAETGVIEGSKLITAFHEKQRFSKDFLRTLKATVAKTDEFIMIDKDGRRSSYLSRILVDRKGYRNIYNAREGIIKWIAAGHPVVKP